MAQWLRVFLASAEDLDLISTWWFTTACNSILGDLMAFDLCGEPCTHVIPRHPCRRNIIYIKLIKNIPIH